MPPKKTRAAKKRRPKNRGSEEDPCQWGDLYLGNLINSLKSPTHPRLSHELHGIGSATPGPSGGQHPLIRDLFLSRCLAMLADTETGWETATSISIYLPDARNRSFEGASGGMSGSPLGDYLEQNPKTVINVPVHISQGRDRIPKVIITDLETILRAVDEIQAGRAGNLSSQNCLTLSPGIDLQISPLIVKLCKRKIMTILEESRHLVSGVWSAMLKSCSASPDETLPKWLEREWFEINELITQALGQHTSEQGQNLLFCQIIKKSYVIRAQIDSHPGVVNKMENLWEGVLSQELNLRRASLSFESLPEITFATDAFDGWIMPLISELPHSMSQTSNSGSTQVGCAYADPQLVHDYIAYQGKYSSLCHRPGDGQPGNPVARFLGQLGKYYQAAIILVQTPFYPQRGRDIQINFQVMPVSQKDYPPSCGVKSMPRLARTFARYWEMQKKGLGEEKIQDAYGSSKLKDALQKRWGVDQTLRRQTFYVHPEMKLLIALALDKACCRAAVKEYCFNGKDRKPISPHNTFKWHLLIGTSRDSCMSCRAFMGEWNWESHRTRNPPSHGRQKHCDEPFLTHMRVNLSCAGQHLNSPRNYKFDPSWLGPGIPGLSPRGAGPNNATPKAALARILLILTARVTAFTKSKLLHTLHNPETRSFLEGLAQANTTHAGTTTMHEATMQGQDKHHIDEEDPPSSPQPQEVIEHQEDDDDLYAFPTNRDMIKKMAQETVSATEDNIGDLEDVDGEYEIDEDYYNHGQVLSTQLKEVSQNQVENVTNQSDSEPNLGTSSADLQSANAFQESPQYHNRDLVTQSNGPLGLLSLSDRFRFICDQPINFTNVPPAVSPTTANITTALPSTTSNSEPQLEPGPVLTEVSGSLSRRQETRRAAQQKKTTRSGPEKVLKENIPPRPSHAFHGRRRPRNREPDEGLMDPDSPKHKRTRVAEARTSRSMPLEELSLRQYSQSSFDPRSDQTQPPAQSSSYLPQATLYHSTSSLYNIDQNYILPENHAAPEISRQTPRTSDTTHTQPNGNNTQSVYNLPFQSNQPTWAMGNPPVPDLYYNPWESVHGTPGNAATMQHAPPVSSFTREYYPTQTNPSYIPPQAYNSESQQSTEQDWDPTMGQEYDEEEWPTWNGFRY